MAGILNNKERLIDFVITNQGRQQMSDGRMRIEYATITDLHTFYQGSGSLEPDVAEDISNRLFFEATDRIQDLIVPEIQAGYSMQPFRTADFHIAGRQIASGTFKTGAIVNTNVLSASEIIDSAPKLLSNLTSNFKNLRILQTSDLFSDTSGFSLTAHTASFVITDNTADFGSNPETDTQRVPLLHLPNIHTSHRFSHFPNFDYLPPVNVRKNPGKAPAPLGVYPQLKESVLSYQDEPAEEWKTVEDVENYLSNKQSVEFSFSDTSRDNNLVVQFFEFGNNSASDGIEKLSIVDYGEFADSIPDPESVGKHVFFIGKIREDQQGAHTFINLFTVVFD